MIRKSNFIGKTVELAPGESGRIVMTNPTGYFRPLIQIGGQLIDLSTTDDYTISIPV